MPTFAFPYAPQPLTMAASTQNGMLPYRALGAQNFGDMLDARLLSTLCRSTSELLRTL